MKERELTPKQERFCQEYIKDLNATQAAIRAGYAAENANVEGSRLLANVNLRDYLNELQGIVAKRNEIDQDWVITRLQTIAERCMQAEPVLDKDGNPTGDYVFQAAGANKALELLGRTLALFIDKSESTVTHVSHEDALTFLAEKANSVRERRETSH